MYLILTSSELELTEFEISFCGSVLGDIQNLCLFVVNLAICHLLIPQKSIVKTTLVTHTYCMLILWCLRSKVFLRKYEAYGLLIGMH